MNVLIKGAKIFNRGTNHHLKTADIKVVDGVITEIGRSLEPNKKSKIIAEKGMCVSPGWIDIGAFNGEPGYEHQEDLSSLKNAAAHGGYVYLAPYPNTKPFLDNKSQVEFLKRRNDNHVVEILPIGAMTKGGEGKEIAEMMDLHKADVVAFSDGPKSAVDKELLLIALQYIKGFNGTAVLDFSYAKNKDGIVNEGAVSVQMGIEGIPEMYELIAINEVLEVNKYVGANVHINNVSSMEAINKIVASKDEKITVGVPHLNLAYSDSDVLNFDVNLKVLPPLRDSKNQKKLAKAVEKGIVTSIATNHHPISEEEKDLEFGQAKYGAIGLETCFATLNSSENGIALESLVNALSTGGYKSLNMDQPTVEVGMPSVLTMFLPDATFSVTKSNIKSKSKNSPLVGKSLKGVVKGVINREKMLILE